MATKKRRSPRDAKARASNSFELLVPGTAKASASKSLDLELPAEWTANEMSAYKELKERGLRVPTCDNQKVVQGRLVGCGTCDNCRNKKKRIKSFFAGHELDSNSGLGVWVTLTYAPENLMLAHTPEGASPEDYKLRATVSKADMRAFLDRFRKRSKYHNLTSGPLRFLVCGEYGSQTTRPHGHGAFFNFPRCQKSAQPGFDNVTQSAPVYDYGCDCISCTTIRECWPHGHIQIAPLHEKAVDYVVKYIDKLYAGLPAILSTHRERPFLLSSRLLGKDWFDKYVDHIAEYHIAVDPETGRKTFRSVTDTTAPIEPDVPVPTHITPHGKPMQLTEALIRRMYKRLGFDKSETEAHLAAISAGHKASVEQVRQLAEKHGLSLEGLGKIAAQPLLTYRKAKAEAHRAKARLSPFDADED